MEARKDFLGVVTDGRDDAHPRDDNPPHDRLACRYVLGDGHRQAEAAALTGQFA
jgi:hypothetical protein